MDDIDLGGFDSYQNLLAYLIPDREPSEGGQDFSPAVRCQLKRLAMAAKGTRNACCMYPRCTTRNPLEVHHHKPRQFGGTGELGNGVLLCRHHHPVVASFSIFPSDVQYFHAGVWHPSVQRLWEFRLEELADRLHHLYGFADFHHERAVLSKFNLIARILQSAYIRRTEDALLANRIVCWASLMLTQPLVVLLDARRYRDHAKGHSRKFIRMLLATAEKHAHCAPEDPLLQAMLFHMRAINSNALGYLSTAGRQAARTESLLKRVSMLSMPIDLPGGFEDYIHAQNALIMAKTSSRKAIALATGAFESSRDKSLGDYIESLCALVKVNLLLSNDWRRAERLLKEAPASERRDKQLKVMTTLAYLRLSQGSFGECEAIAKEARSLADATKRRHTVAKMEQLLDVIGNDRDSLKTQLRAARYSGRGLPHPIARVL